MKSQGDERSRQEYWGNRRMSERSDKGKEKDLSELYVRLNTNEEKHLYLLARQ